MSALVRLSHRVSELFGLSRAEAEQFIQNGWVSVDGIVIDLRAPDAVTTADNLYLCFLAALKRAQHFINDAVIDQRLQALGSLHGVSGGISGARWQRLTANHLILGRMLPLKESWWPRYPMLGCPGVSETRQSLRQIGHRSNVSTSRHELR
jgi:hypothetical protein